MTEIFIKNGEWAIEGREYGIVTDLGSCVALCLWDPNVRLGGMNHYLLPGTENGIKQDPSHGHYANKTLIHEMLRKGASLKTLQGAVIGGGSLQPAYDYFGIGDANIEAAEFALAISHIPMVYKRTGGNVSRYVKLDIAQGLVHVREIQMGTGVMSQYRHQFQDR